MEAFKDGKLVRQHHPGFTVRISSADGMKYRVRRSGLPKPDDARTIVCNSVYVSRKHCEIVRKDKAFKIKDLGSSNGTYLGGVKLTPDQERELRFGDIIGMGISHVTTDEQISPTDEKCFIFKFEMEDNELEVVDLDDDEDPTYSKGKQKDIPKQNSSKDEEDSDEDIQFVEEVELNQSAISSGSAEKTSISPRKAMPPPPPPPIISESFAAKCATANKASSTRQPSTSKPSSGASSSSLAPSIRDQQRPSTIKSSHSTNNTTDENTKNKRSLQTSHPEPPGKRSRQDPDPEALICSDSDDSSDGLGDIDKVVASDTRRRNRNRISSGDDDNSTDDDEKNDDTSTGEPVWNNISTEKKEMPAKKNKPGPACSKLQDSSSRNLAENQRAHQADEENHDDSRSKYDDELKDIASSDSCRVNLQQIILCTKGKYTLTKQIYDAFEPKCRIRMQAQFRESLHRNSQLLNFTSSVGNSKSDLKRGKESSSSPSSSDSENDSESSRNKRKRLCNRENVPDNLSSPDENMDNEQPEIADIDDDENVNHEPHHDPVANQLKTPEAEKPKTPQRSRSIQLLDDAPLPRFAARAQFKNAPYKQPAPQSASKLQKVQSHTNGPSPQGHGSSHMTREEEKQMRIRKLREIELKKQQEKEPTTPTSPKKAAAKIKLTSRNRNQGLMESIIDSKSPGSPEHEPVTVTEKHIVSNGELAHKDDDKLPKITLRDPRLSSRSHVIPHDPRLKKNVPPQNKLPAAKHNGQASRSSPSHPHVPSASSSKASVNILKPCAEVILSQHSNIAPVSYKEKPKFVPSAPVNFKKPAHLLAVSEDDIYRRILIWRPVWLEEQKNVKKDPPILKENESLTTTLIRYDTFDAYFKIYYPLLLSEIWACISSDNGNRGKTDSTMRSQTKRTEYNIKIDEIKRESTCSLVKRTTEKPPVDEIWTNISYHTCVKQVGDIDYRKDLVLLTIDGTDKDTGNTCSKTIFGFPRGGSDRYDPINKLDECDSRLRIKDGHRFTETIVCKFGLNFIVDKNKLGKVNRICNITPKLREFRALNNLQSYRLFDKIITPREDPKYSWQTWLNQNAEKKSDDMISICRQLNLDQQAVIRCVSRRVSSDEPELMLMHGPPGTGKTTTIVALVLQLLVSYQKLSPSRNHRILICTPSNAAIDEIMRRLGQAIDRLPNTSQSGKKISMVRVGETYAPELKKYAVDTRVKEEEEEKSTARSIKAEIADVENEIEELKRKINEIKEKKHSEPIALEAKLSSLKELEERKRSLNKDYNNVLVKGKINKGELQTRRNAVIANTQIVCSTLSASSTKMMKNFVHSLSSVEKTFLCCIVDEASQTTEPETLLPLVLNIDKLLLVGDPFQLGATVLSNSAEEKNYGQSLFSRHYQFYSSTRNNNRSANPVMPLTRQYRMHPDIVKWPNNFTYESSLRTIYTAPQKNYLLRPYYFLNLSSGKEHTDKGQIKNTDEVFIVKALVETIDEILEISNLKWTIGIITPYAAQKQSIRDDFKNKKFKSFEKVEIDTVDGFQGQERDIIILSCVRTDGTGFLKSKNRLNVALTRAKHSMYIIGDGRCLSTIQMWRCLIQDAARGDNKFEVNPEFQRDVKLLKTQLYNNLKKKTV